MPELRIRRFADGLATALTVVALVGAAGPPAIAAAQVAREPGPSLLSLRLGDTVRVWASRPPLARTVAVIAELGGETLVLRDLRGRRALPDGGTVALPAVTRLEVQRGHRRSAGWAVAGVVLGLAGGTVVGAVAGKFIECGRSCAEEGEYGGFTGIVVFGGVGAVTGAVAGGFRGGRRRPRWEPVALPER